MTQPQRTLTTPWAKRCARLVGSALCLFLLAPAATAQVPGFVVTNIEEVSDFDLVTDRFGRTGATTRRRINLADCEAYRGQEIEISIGLALAEDSDLVVKLQAPGQTCSKDTTTDDDDCNIVDTEVQKSTDTNYQVTISMDELMFGDEVPDCDTLLEDDAFIYVAVKGQALDISELASTIEIEIDFDPPSAPEVTSTGGGDSKATVNWDDSANDANKDRTFIVYWSTSPIDEDNKDSARSEAIGTATTYDIDDSLTNGVTYYVAVTAVDTADNESSLSNVATVVPQPSTDFWEAYQGAGGTDTGGFCFIATVSYGSPMAGELGTLRAFRDQVLLPTAAGQRFVAEYYMWGRFAAAWIADKPMLKWVTRVLLTPLVWFAQLALATSFGWALLLFALGFLGIVVTTRRALRWRRLQVASTNSTLVEGAR